VEQRKASLNTRSRIGPAGTFYTKKKRLSPAGRKSTPRERNLKKESGEAKVPPN